MSPSTLARAALASLFACLCSTCADVPPEELADLPQVAVARAALVPEGFRLETGTAMVGAEPVTVQLEHTYDDPVVIASIQYANNSVPVVSRVGDVTSNSFTVYLQNPLDQTPVADRVQYLVVEEGVWNVDGIAIEAGKVLSTVTDHDNSWTGEERSYGQTYVAPVVLGQVMSVNDPRWTYFWSSDIDRSQPPSPSHLIIGKHAGADATWSERAPETLGYVVIEAGAGTLGGREFRAGVTRKIDRQPEPFVPLQTGAYKVLPTDPPMAIPPEQVITSLTASTDFVQRGCLGYAFGNPASTIATALTAQMHIGLDNPTTVDRACIGRYAYLTFVKPAVVPAAECGNGVLEPGEACDDGNQLTEYCAAGQPCPACDSGCEEATGSYCGDGILQPEHAEVCDDGNALNGDACDASCTAATPKLEAGEVVAGPLPVVVELEHDYFSPVVVTTIQLRNNTSPVVTRLRNVTGSSFELYLQSPSGAPIAADEVFYLVVEEGAWTVEGVELEAWNYLSERTSSFMHLNAEERQFSHTYADPVVLGQVMSDNDGLFTTFFSAAGPRDRLYLGKHAGSDPDWAARAAEDVGYVVLDAGDGVLAGVEYRAGNSDFVFRPTPPAPGQIHVHNTPRLTPPMTTPPEVVIGASVFHNNVPCLGNLWGEPSASATDVYVLPDRDISMESWSILDFAHLALAKPLVWPAAQCGDGVLDPGEACDDGNQATEYCAAGPSCAACNSDCSSTTIAYCGDGLLQSEHGEVCDDANTFNGDGCDSTCAIASPQLETGSVTVGAAPVLVPLEHAYASPVVVTTIRNVTNTLPVVTRVRDAQSNSFEIYLQNPSGETPTAEEVMYLVVEEGVWNIDGLRLEARKHVSQRTSWAGQWVGEERSYGQTYTSPVVLGQVMSENDPRFSTFWSSDGNRFNSPSAEQLYIGKHAGSDRSWLDHANEVLGYVVLEAGSGSIGGVEYRTAVSPPFTRNSAYLSRKVALPAVMTSPPEVLVGTLTSMYDQRGCFVYFSEENPATEDSFWVTPDRDMLGGTSRDCTNARLAYLALATDISIGAGGEPGPGGPDVGCDGSGAPWPGFRMCLTHQAYSSAHGPSAPDPALSFATGGEVESSPAIGSEGTVYVGSNDGHLYALNSNMQLAWAFETPGPVRSSPAIGPDGTILVGSSDGLYAINSDGSLKWKFPTSAPVRSSPAVDPNGTSYFGCDDGSFYAVASSGWRLWSYRTVGVVRSAPAIGTDGTIYFGSDDWRFFALNPNGTEKWIRSTRGPVTASPAIGLDGAIVVGSQDGHLYALDADTGVPKWSHEVGDYILSSPAIAPDGTIIVGDHTDRVRALNPEDGTLKWEHVTGGDVLSSPAIDGAGRVYVGSNDHKLYALNATDGTELWSYATGGEVVSSPAISDDGAIVFGSNDNTLYLIGRDLCPEDADKTLPGECGCGTPEETADACTSDQCGVVTACTMTLDCDAIWGPCSGSDVCIGNECLPCTRSGTDCTTECPCGSGEGDCTSDAQCEADLMCVGGVCISPICTDSEHPLFECGTSTSLCGPECPECPSGAPDCTDKSCGSDGCFGTCGTTCQQGEGCCDSDLDCADGLVCGVGNGPAFGRSADCRVCWPPLCDRLDQSTVPCGATADPCGICKPCDAVANCQGSNCGPDGCGGHCGTPGADEYCAPLAAQPGPADGGDTGGELIPKQFTGGDNHDSADESDDVSGFGRTIPIPPEAAENLPPPATDSDLPQIETQAAGTTSGALTVTPLGSARYSIPIEVPPGRAGMAPELRLVYDSHGPNGHLGQGWRLDGLSAITLCGKDIAQDGEVSRLLPDDPSDQRYCLDGMRLVTEDSSAQYGADGTTYRRQVDDFSRATSHGDTGNGPERFEVRTKDGRIWLYENQVLVSAPELDDGPRPRAPITWLLSKVEDRAGNQMDITYRTNDRDLDRRYAREFYPQHIIYTGYSDTPGRNTVTFHYKDRNDVLEGYVAGNLLVKEKLLDRIETRVEGRTVREYRLEYFEDDYHLTIPERDLEGDISMAAMPRRSMLSLVRECAQRVTYGLSQGDLVCKKPTVFEYERVKPGTESGEPPCGDPAQCGYPDDDSDDFVPRHTVLDINGNGIDDILFDVVDGDSTRWHLLLDNNEFIDTGLEIESRTIFVVDWDHDGRDDILERSAASREPRVTATGRCKDARPSAFGGNLRVLRWSETSSDLEVTATDIRDPRVDRRAVCKEPVNAPFEEPPRLRRVGKHAGVYVLDLNGDGLRDIVTCEIHEFSSVRNWAVHMHRAQGGFDDPITSYAPFDFVECGQSLIVDSDGDGAHELLIVHDDHYDHLDFASPRPVVHGAAPYGSDALTIPMDTNGDGLVDLVHFEPHDEPDKVGVSVWHNSGWVTHDTPSVAQRSFLPLPTTTFDLLDGATTATAMLALSRGIVYDYNRDGRSDFLFWRNVDDQNTDLEPKILLSEGTSFRLVDGVLQGSEKQGFRSNHTVYDANGDGLPDIGRVSAEEGHPWRVAYGRGPHVDRLVAVTEHRFTESPNGLDGARQTIEYGSLNDPAVYEHFDTPPEHACRYPVSCEHPRGFVVRRVRAWDAAVVDVENPPEPAGDLEYRFAHGARNAQGRTSLGFGHILITDLKRRGPGLVPLETLLSFQNLWRDSVTGRHPFVGVPHSRITRGVTRAGRHRITTRSDSYFRGEGYCAPSDRRTTMLNVCKSLVQVTEGDAGATPEVVQTAETSFHDYDEFGNPKSVTTAWNDGAQYTRSFAYMHEEACGGSADAYESAWLVGLPCEISETSAPDPSTGLPSQSRAVTYDYFDASDGSASNCGAGGFSTPTDLLQATVRDEGDARLELTTTYCRDAFGNATMVSRSGNVAPGESQVRSHIIDYDASGTFPAAVTDTNGHTVYYDYDPAHGGLQGISRERNYDSDETSSDPEHITSVLLLDGFGRERYRVNPDGSVDSTDYLVGWAGSLFSVWHSGNGAPTSVVTYDVLGRPVRHQIDGFKGKTLVSSIGYDDQGRLESISRPRAGGDTAPPTTFTYDVFDRQLTVTPPEATEARKQCYHNGVSCETDGRGYTRCLKTDTHGRVILSVDPAALTLCEDQAKAVWNSGGSGTSYLYGAFNAPARMTDSANNQTEIATDHHGRTVLLADPDLGARGVLYNAFGEVETEFIGFETTSYRHDLLGRLTSRTDVGAGAAGEDLLTTWKYDDGGLYGAVHQSTSPFGTRLTHGYDEVGRLDSLTRTIDGEDFVLGLGYDARSRPDLLTFNYPGPSGSEFRVQPDYDDESGRLRSIAPFFHPSDPYWELISTNDFDQAWVEQLSDGAMKTTRTHYEKTGRLHTLIAETGAVPLLDIEYVFDANGNVDYQIDRRVPTFGDEGAVRKRDYAYDRFDRLVSAQHFDASELLVGNATWSYDAIGNIESRWATGTGFAPVSLTYEYNGMQPHAVTRVIQSGGGALDYAYDPKGRLRRRMGPLLRELGSESDPITYTPFHKPARVPLPGTEEGEAALLYDADQSRVQKRTLGSATVYFDDLYYRTTNLATGEQEHHFLISNAEGVVAEVVRRDGAPEETRYHRRDRLGSSTVITDDAGTEIERRENEPFGQRKQTPNGTSKSLVGFTGHMLDAEMDLIDMGARLYDPFVGRFVTPDPIIGDPFFSQDLNRYAYVRNNPLRYTDPTGTTGTEVGLAAVACSTGAGCALVAGGTIVVGLGIVFREELGGLLEDIGDAFSDLFGGDDEPPPPPPPQGLHQDGAAARSSTSPAYVPSARRSEVPLEGRGAARSSSSAGCYEYGCAMKMNAVLSQDVMVETQNAYADLGEKATTAFEAMEVVGDAALTVADLAGVDGSPGVPTIAGPIASKWANRRVSRAGTKAAEFGKRSVGAAERVWTKSARMKAAQLPHRGGKVRYVPPKSWHPSEPLPRGPNRGYLDRFGNEWTKGPSRTRGEAFEWDVQLRGGGHWNVSLQGHITH